MSTKTGRDYYLKKLPQLMKQYRTVEAQLAKTLTPHFNHPKIQTLLAETRKAYEMLIPKLPDIGGDANPALPNLIDSAYSLIVLLSLEREGLSMRDMAEVLYKTFESVCNLTSPEKRQKIRDFYFSKDMSEIAGKACSVSRLRKYPGDWVYDYVDGDGERFDYGYDFSECGIVKFYHQMDADRFTPILCLTDYANFRSLGVGFTRTHKISMGDPICDFRFIKGYDTPSGWPPDCLEEAFPF